MSKRREERRGEERGSRDELPARVPRSETEIEALDRSTDAMDVDEEVKKLVDEMKRLGSADETGTLKVKFGVLFRDTIQNLMLCGIRQIINFSCG